MTEKLTIARNWLPRYTGMALDEIGDYILLTNFRSYLNRFATRFDCEIHGADRPMPAATNSHGLTMIHIGMGSANAATIMDLLSARSPRGFCCWANVEDSSSLRKSGTSFCPSRPSAVKAPATIIFLPKSPPCPLSNCISSCPKRSLLMAMNTAPGWSIPPTGGSGNTTRPFWSAFRR